MKKITAILLALVMVLALFGCSKKEEPTTTAATTTTETTTQPAPIVNPLTGDENFSESAVGRRPVAIVVENLAPARPQWGINSPDIIVEGEVEGGISRMLWLYADYKSVPEKIGPIRSARPSYVKFSEYFDSIYIHWGGSHSKGNYTGGYSVIKKDKVDHIDGMNGGELYGRYTTRSVSSEHRGIVYGNKIAAAIKKKGFRTKLNEDRFTALSFNDEIKNAGTDKAVKVKVKFSSRTDTRAFTYSTEDNKYHTNDWKTDVSFENVIILSGESTYITTPYKGSSTTYLNYALKGGSGYYASNGTITKITWSTDGGILKLTDDAGKELSINKGNSYIALTSSNHEGKTTFSAE